MEDACDVVAFAPFVPNELDPLWVFSDGVFHSECFSRHPLAERARARLAYLHERTSRPDTGYPLCALCEREITDPDAYITLGHLTDDVASPMYRYNCVQAHEYCLARWDELPRVYRWLEEQKRAGAWRGVALDWLLTKLRRLQMTAGPQSRDGRGPP